MIFRDQIGHQIKLQELPKKIISVVPSQTELLYDLGLENEVIGITKFCIHPNNWHKTKERVGGTKTLNIDKIKGLSPDLIIANKEENTKEQIELLQELYPVWTSDIFNLKDSLQMIETIGAITNREKKSKEIIEKIDVEFGKLREFNKYKTALYLIWKNPYMSIGKTTFINDMMSRAGLVNVLNKEERYPELSINQITKLNPEIILLSSEPYPFKEKDIKEFEEMCPQSKILLVDGEMFSWYGSRLLKSVSYFVDLNDKFS